MTIKWDTTDLESSTVLKAEHINDASDALDGFVNRGINSAELKEPVDFVDNTIDPYEKKGWLTSDKIYRPEFYGSPSPRMMAVSGQTHFREVQNDWSSGVIFHADTAGTSPVSVPNCATRVKLKHRATVNIMASFYMFEFGGVALAANEQNIAIGSGGAAVLDPAEEVETQASRGYESLKAGTAFLQINGVNHNSTFRRIYTSCVGPHTSVGEERQERRYVSRGFVFLPMIGRHQHNILMQIQLPPGVHDIGLVFQPNNIHDVTNVPEYRLLDNQWRNARDLDPGRDSLQECPRFKKIKHMYFLARNFIVDCYYNSNFEQEIVLSAETVSVTGSYGV